jgi:hypothetical protein
MWIADNFDHNSDAGFVLVLKLALAAVAPLTQLGRRARRVALISRKSYWTFAAAGTELLHTLPLWSSGGLKVRVALDPGAAPTFGPGGEKILRGHIFARREQLSLALQFDPIRASLCISD